MVLFKNQTKHWLALIERRALLALDDIETASDARQVIRAEIALNALTDLLFDLNYDPHFAFETLLKGAEIRDRLIKRVDSLVTRKLSELREQSEKVNV